MANVNRVANETIALLKADLERDFSGSTITTGDDGSGNPTLSIDDGVTDNVVLFRIIQESFPNFPIPSLASTTDGRPNVMQVGVTSTTGTADTAQATLVKVLARAKDQNMYIQVVGNELGTGNDPTVANTFTDLESGSPTAVELFTIVPNTRWANTGK